MRSTFYLRRMGAAAVLAAMLSACSLSASGQAPTPIVATLPAERPTTAPAATTVAAVTPAPATAVATVPTAVPATIVPTTPPAPATPEPRPLLGFAPNAGGAGTPINLSGYGYTPGAMVVVRLGMPNPIGEVLASAQADSVGRWSAQLVMPDRLPSGDPIASGEIRLVAMNERNEALASAPFSYSATPPVIESPGPGWVFALESDANLDGVADRIFYRPANSPPDLTFDDPRLATIAVPVTDVALMQTAPSGAQILLSIDIHGGRADQSLFDFAGRREPSAYLLALDPARGPLLNLLPYGASGAGYGGPIGIDWEAGAHGFRLVGEQP